MAAASSSGDGAFDEHCGHPVATEGPAQLAVQLRLVPDGGGALLQIALTCAHALQRGQFLLCADQRLGRLLRLCAQLRYFLLLRAMLVESGFQARDVAF